MAGPPGAEEFEKNQLYYGDNLDVLRRKIAAESVARSDAVKSAAAKGDADKQGALKL